MTELKDLLKEKNLTIHRCSQLSSIPYATLSDLVSKKTDIRKCSVDTFSRLALVLDMSMDDLYHTMNDSCRVSFETFKGNVCHSVKENGDMQWIIDTLKQDTVSTYWSWHWYPEAFYTLAMLDYLSRINGIEICRNYDSIRKSRLKDTIYPRDVELTADMNPETDEKAKVLEESIPEFRRFNIAEMDVRNVI